jgi:hypothetical protein
MCVAASIALALGASIDDLFPMPDLEVIVRQVEAAAA